MLTITPAEQTLHAHITAGRFELAITNGHWTVPHVAFPTVDVHVFGRAGGLDLRFDVMDYPTRAPAGRPWDAERGVPLEPEYWPTGGRADATFRKDWSAQHNGALYIALDRIALESHSDWAHRHDAWTSSRSIYDYLLHVHHVLRAADIPLRPTS
jgi:hypothetical protein